jgi:pimeloyl-ACP methyl ester carboxylesterase
MLRVDVSGLTVAYEQAGKGPALVLLHGFTQDARTWRPQLAGLSGQFRVIAWDAPGAGESFDPPEQYALSDWAHCLAGLLETIGVHSAHILGLSWGGILAQEYYRRYPARVLSLVLADTYAGWKGSLPEQVTQERLAACLKDAVLPPHEFVPRYLPGMFSDHPSPEILEHLAAIMADFHPRGFHQMAVSSAQADTRHILPTIRVPTLLLWGDADKRSPISIAHQMLQVIPAAKLIILPSAGHVSNLEAPDLFNAALLSFYASLMTR